jgi:hypothetical protein
MRRNLLVLLPLVVSSAAPAISVAQQMPAIGIVDFYGLRQLRDSTLRRVLGVASGDAAPDSAGRAAAVRRLRAVPGVVDARLDVVCCHEEKSLLFVGILEQGASSPEFRPEPTGRERLPDEVLAAGRALDAAAQEAMEHGDFAEDQSAGHALMHYPAARQAQERFVDLADRHGPRLREVLRDASDAGQRALAAQVLAYAADKRGVVKDLVRAIGDPAEEVRNNAMRALALIAQLGERRPELRLEVPIEPFVAMVNSPVWTDRNKASFALMSLTETRDDRRLAAIRAGALSALVEIARWRSPAHALAGIFVLGRLAGMSDEASFKAAERGDVETVVQAATGQGAK